VEKVVFLDRDGVINIEKNYLYKIEDFEFVDGVFESLQYLTKFGYKFVIVTNQSGIGRGYYTKNDFDKLTLWMLEQFNLHNIEIEGVFCCPHAPNENCDCRKPKTGMVKQAQEIIDIDFENSWMVGDKDSDIQMAKNANIKNTIQVQSGHTFEKNDSQANYILQSVAYLPSIIKS
jgi:D-glycero-D-manno-heptose 1,7-bisphosphate phosphatase